jgi:peroxiredoxin
MLSYSRATLLAVVTSVGIPSLSQTSFGSPIIAAPAKPSTLLKVKDKAPPINLDPNNWLNIKEGKIPSLNSYTGKVVLVEFWGTWCGPCIDTMPLVQRMYDRYHSRGLEVIAISYEAPDDLRTFVREKALTFPVGADPEKKVINAYGPQGWPTSILIGKDGNVALIGTPAQLEIALEKLLGKIETKSGTLSADEFSALLKGGNYQAALHALATRKSPSAIFVMAATDPAFITYCGDNSERWLLAGKKGVMVQHWAFPERIPTAKAREFTNELAPTDVGQDKKGKVVTLRINDTMVTPQNIAEFTKSAWQKHLVAKALFENTQAIANGEKIELSTVEKDAADQAIAFREELEIKYPYEE